MRMQQRDAIEAYTILILLDRENEPLQTIDIKFELERNFIDSPKMPNPHTLAASFRRSGYFISEKGNKSNLRRYKISPEIYEKLQPHIPELFQLASSPKNLSEKIRKYLS
mgnify:CR=1 FL=1